MLEAWTSEKFKGQDSDDPVQSCRLFNLKGCCTQRNTSPDARNGCGVYSLHLFASTPFMFFLRLHIETIKLNLQFYPKILGDRMPWCFLPHWERRLMFSSLLHPGISCLLQEWVLWSCSLFFFFFFCQNIPKGTKFFNKIARAKRLTHRSFLLYVIGIDLLAGRANVQLCTWRRLRKLLRNKRENGSSNISERPAPVFTLLGKHRHLIFWINGSARSNRVSVCATMELFIYSFWTLFSQIVYTKSRLK